MPVPPHADGVSVKIMGAKQAAVPSRLETGQNAVFRAELAIKRDPKIFFYEWTFGQGQPMGKAAGLEQTYGWSQPGSYEVTVKVYELDAMGFSKKEPVLATTKQTVLVESSLNDAKFDIKVKITGLQQIQLGQTANLTATVEAPAHLQAKLQPVQWFLGDRQGNSVTISNPIEDPDNTSRQSEQGLGQGATLQYRPVSSGRWDFVARVYGQGVSDGVAQEHFEVNVMCRQDGKEQVCSESKTPTSNSTVLQLAPSVSP